MNTSNLKLVTTTIPTDYATRILRYSNLSSETVNRIVEQVTELESRERSVSSKYQPISSLQLLTDTLEQLMEMNYHVNSAKVIYVQGGKSTKHFIELTLPIDLKLDGGMIPRIYIVNSYNGECSASVQIGLFRLVCSNGLMVGTNYFSRSVIHRVGERVVEFEKTIPAVIPAAIGAVCELARKVDELKAKELSIPEQLKVIEALGLSERITKQLLQYTERQANGYLRREDSQRNLWTLFNIVNEVIRANSHKEFSTITRNETLLESIESAFSKLVA